MNIVALKKKARTLDRKCYRLFSNVVGITKDRTTKNLYIIFRFALLASITVLLFNFILRIEFIFGEDLKLGEFGDFLGGVLNPILTFLMFLGLIITIVLQKTELALARKEFKRTADALNSQSLSSQQQVLETTFFNLLRIHSDTVESLKISPDTICCWLIDKSASGRSVFSVVVSLLYVEDKPDKTFSNYCDFQNTENHLLGHYFRSMYQVLKFISESDLPEQQQKHYSRLLRAQLSADELALLFFNCLCPSVDKGQFKKLVIKYKMLEHLNLGKEDFMEHFSISGQAVYTDKNRLLSYIQTKEGVEMQSAFGANPVAIKELYT